MRIAYVNQDGGISPTRQKGAAVHLIAMREAFQRLGAEVISVDESDGGEVLRRLDAAHAEGPITMVYERYALHGTSGARFARKLNVPYVLEVNAPLSEEEQRWRGGTPASAEDDEELVFRSASLVIAVSTQVAEYAVRSGAAADRVHVFPNGVDTDRFQPRKDDGLRNELVPEADRLVLGFHGRLRPWHGFGRLVEVMDRLLKRGVPAHLVTVGVGDFQEHLQGVIPPDRVSSVAWVEHHDVGRYVATFDVLPITYAPNLPCYFSPLKLAEAMSCGVVPVVPDLGDLRSVVEDGGNGLVYPADDLAVLEEHIYRLWNEPALRAKLAQGAIDKAEALSWTKIADFALKAAQKNGAPARG